MPKEDWTWSRASRHGAFVLLLLLPTPVSADERIVTAAVLRDFSPLYRQEADGKPSGFAVDILRQVAERAGWQVRYHMVENWDEAAAAVRERRADLVPAMAITNKWREEFLFSEYVEALPVSCFVRRDSPADCADLTGRRVAAIRQGAAYQLLEKRPGVQLVGTDNIEKSLFQLLSGEVDLFAAPQPVVLAKLAATGLDDRLQIAGRPLMELKRAMLLHRDHASLRDIIDPILRDYVSSNAYLADYQRWYGKPAPYWTVDRLAWTMGAALAGVILLFTVWRILAQRWMNRLLASQVAALEASDGRLRALHGELEERVLARTRELDEANGHLRTEIEERKAVEEALRVAKEAAERAARSKSEFLANMSHEIRTPMNAIIGMADLLEERSLDETARHYVRIFRSAGEVLMAILNDILDMAKIEAGQIELERVSFNLRELVENTADIVALRIHGKGVELISHIADTVPGFVLGDPVRLQQVLMNLLGNAAKFTDAGQVTLDVSLVPDHGGNALQFAVEDTGIGIASDKLSSIFESFVQADTTTTRRYGGTGLGLAISRHLVQRMGGVMGVESTPGQGSRFHFRIPCQAAGITVASRPGIDLSGTRVLVVDDNTTNRLVAREALTALGADVGEAEDGRQALEGMRLAMVQGMPFHLLLLDRRMPEMDGFQVVERMREDMTAIPVVLMLTSDNREEDFARCGALGIERYLIKPLKRGAIQLLVAQAAQRAKRDRPAAAENLPAQQRPLRILLAEDAEDNRLLVQAYLKETPHLLTFAEDGETAVRKVQEEPFDLVLMDIQMPVMDGFTATRRIRAWERDTRRLPLPIVALTAFALQEDVHRALQAGCTAHISKPIKKKRFVDEITRYAQLLDPEPVPLPAQRQEP